MELIIRGRNISEADLGFIRDVISKLNHRGRFHISIELCRAWNWIAPDGRLKDAACRALLLGLEARGLIVLPRRLRCGIGQRPRQSLERQPQLPLARSALEQHLTCRDGLWHLADGSAVSLYKDLLDAHHYLGYRREVGPSLRYIAWASQEPIACLGWAAAAQKVAARDQFIGWTAQQRQKNLHRVINNTRFLVIQRVPHLASRLLASNIRRLACDWKSRYGYAPVLLETFVDITRFKGTCYKAANWTQAGLTQGRGKYDRHTRRPKTVKAVFLYPLSPEFRQILCHG